MAACISVSQEEGTSDNDSVECIESTMESCDEELPDNECENQVDSLETELKTAKSLLLAKKEKNMFSTQLSCSLFGALECPNCLAYMIPPIGLCSNGHNTCSQCRPKMEHCPICRKGFIETRNIAMEAIARELLYPCRNYGVGCEEKYPLELINEHQSQCPLRLYTCMFNTADGCQWKGRKYEILDHARNVHADNIWTQEKFSLVYTNFNNSCNADLISALDEMFILHRQYDVEKQRLYAVVQYVGPSENTALYKYEFEFIELGKLRSVLFRYHVQPDSKDKNDIFESGDCVSLGFDVLVNFIKDNELWCTVSISRV